MAQENDRETKRLSWKQIESSSNRRSFRKSKENPAPKNSVIILDDPFLQVHNVTIGTQILDDIYSKERACHITYKYNTANELLDDETIVTTIDLSFSVRSTVQEMLGFLTLLAATNNELLECFQILEDTIAKHADRYKLQ